MDCRGAGVLKAIDEIRAHLDRGAPWDACDVFREAIAQCPGDADLCYWGALAHARAGATQTAHAILDEAEQASIEASRREDLLSLRGRLWKDAVHRAGDRHDAVQWATRARDCYVEAYAIAHDSYPGINAATLSWLLDDRHAAVRLASDVVNRIAPRAPEADCWAMATLGEAQLLLGEPEAGRRSYEAAYRLAAGNAGTIATMRRQLKLLAGSMPEAKGVLSSLKAPDVLAFAGHMIDAPDRPVPRFPIGLAPAVHSALRRYLATLHQPIVFCSPACGADLLLVDAALECDAEVNLVLPFDRGDFVRTSVAIGGEEWIERFDRALERATRVIMATHENYLGDDLLFDHAARLVEGLAILRAAQLETSAALLCVMDREEEERVGGTFASHERWRRNIGVPNVIDLAAVRRGTGRVDANAVQRDRRQSRAEGASSPVPAATPRSRSPRTLKALMFADFAGFSRVQDAFAPLFHERFLQIGAAQIAASPAKPLDAKTWGDALYAVFESPIDAAEFALRFLAATLEADWTAAGLAATNRVRIALHAGPVYRGFDPVMDREDFFGSNVTRAARIEPVTQAGTIYASEAFAATLAATGQQAFALEYIGNLRLAKAYGESRIYRLDRR